MKLRSGRILNAPSINPPNIPKVESLWERQRKLELQDDMVNELKTLFRFIYYHSGVRFANKERIAEIEKERRVTINEILDWNDDLHFWTLWFSKVRPHFAEQHVFNLFPEIMKQEYSITSEDLVYDEVRLILKEYVRNVYNFTTCCPDDRIHGRTTSSHEPGLAETRQKTIPRKDCQ